MHPDMGPVIKASSFEIAVFQFEAQRLNEMELNAKGRAESRYIPRIRGNFRFMEDYQHSCRREISGRIETGKVCSDIFGMAGNVWPYLASNAHIPGSPAIIVQSGEYVRFHHFNPGIVNSF